MTRKTQWLLIAGLILPVGVGYAQTGPRVQVIRPRVERRFSPHDRMFAARRWQVRSDLLRHRAMLGLELRRRYALALRGRAFGSFGVRRPGFLIGPRLGRRHSIRI
jgi:hypothetical protein